MVPNAEEQLHPGQLHSRILELSPSRPTRDEICPNATLAVNVLDLIAILHQFGRPSQQVAFHMLLEFIRRRKQVHNVSVIAIDFEALCSCSRYSSLS